MSQQGHQMLMLEDDPAFRRYEQLITRFGWIVLALFVVAGFVGLLVPAR